MEILKKKLLKGFLLFSVFILIISAALGGWLAYGNPFTSAKIKVYRALPVPMAFVGTRAILMKDFLRRYELARAFYPKDVSSNEGEVKNNIAQSLIRQKELEAVAQGRGIKTDKKQIEAEYERREIFSLEQESRSLNSLLADQGLSAEDFKQLILKPDLLATNLIIWFNGQENLNTEALAKAREIKTSLDGGTDMAALAPSQSQDNASKQLEGDMGFVESSQILPELQGGLDAMAIGETKIFASRYGVHVIKLAEKDNRGEQNSARAHLFQIFIKPADFQQWYENETKNIKVTNIIKI